MRFPARRGALMAPAVVLGLLLPTPSWAAGTRPAPRRSRTAPAPAPVRQPGWAVDRVRFEPLDPHGSLLVDGVGEYRGVMEATRSGGGVAAVDDVTFDDYLDGIAEVPATWPAEALKAQVVAARTYAL